MDYKVYPQACMNGRITNIPELRHSYRGSVYTKIFLYLYHDKTALLMPIIAFNKTAKRLTQFTQQGDLLKIRVRISPVPNRGYLNPTLVAYDFSFLEPLEMRQMYHGDTGKKLKMLFPVVPQNYSKSTSKTSPKHKMHKATSTEASSATDVKVVSAEIESSTSSKASSATPHIKDTKSTTDDWIRHANQIDMSHFPGKNKGDER